MGTFSLIGGVTVAGRHGRDAAPRLGAQFDAVLVAAQAGAEWAWTLLYRSVAAPVRGYFVAQGSAVADALLGEVFRRLGGGIANFNGDEQRFRSWVFSLAHEQAVEERRRGRRAATGASHDLVVLPDGPSLDSEARRALGGLTPEQRDVVLLRVFADLPPEEVSRIVRRPVSAVRTLHRRGLARLEKKLTTDPYPRAAVWR